MFPRLFCSMICLSACLLASSQTFEETEFVVVDRGVQMNGSDGELRLYTHSGGFLSTLPSVGSNQYRGGAFADTGELFVARGNDIWRFVGNPLLPDVAPFATGTKAQDVVVNSADGHVFCAFGNNTASATILEYDDTGTLVQTITDPLLVHPRSLAIDYAGNTLFIANQSGGNILAVDIAAGTVQQHVDIAASIANFGPIGITLPRDTDDLMYVVGDYGSGPTEVVEIVGPTGSATVNTFLNFGSLPDLKAPAGAISDNYGNLFFAGRSKNMGVPGIYVYNRATGQRTTLPYVGTEHLNPIDITFRKTMIGFTLTSSDGVSATTGLPHILWGIHNTQITIDIQAPDYPLMPFAILYSLMTDTVCLDAALDPPRPLGGGIPFQVPDTRIAPLLPDAFFFQSLALIQAGGNGAPVVLDPTICPGSNAGFFLRPQGATDASGNAQAILTMPSLPCLPPNFVAYMAFSLSVVDMQTQPTLVGAATSHVVCVAIERP